MTGGQTEPRTGKQRQEEMRSGGGEGVREGDASRDSGWDSISLLYS